MGKKIEMATIVFVCMCVCMWGGGGGGRVRQPCLCSHVAYCQSFFEGLYSCFLGTAIITGLFGLCFSDQIQYDTISYVKHSVSRHLVLCEHNTISKINNILIMRCFSYKLSYNVSDAV